MSTVGIDPRQGLHKNLDLLSAYNLFQKDWPNLLEEGGSGNPGILFQKVRPKVLEFVGRGKPSTPRSPRFQKSANPRGGLAG